MAEVDKRFFDSQQDIDKRIDNIQEDRNRAESKLKELQLWEPHAQEKATIREELQLLDIEEKESYANKQTKEQTIERLRAFCNKICNSCKMS